MSLEGKFNCLSLHSKCKAMCCSVAPIEIEIYKRNLHRRVREVIYEYDGKFYDQIDKTVKHLITPTTECGYCPFLREDLHCNIQDDKPEVCKKYGNEEHQCLRCPFQDKHGNVRSRQQSRAILREASKAKDKLIAEAEKILKKEENRERINNEIRLSNKNSHLHNGNNRIPHLYSNEMQGL